MVESTHPVTPFGAAVGAVGIPIPVLGSVAAPQNPPPMAPVTNRKIQ